MCESTTIIYISTQNFKARTSREKKQEVSKND